MMKISNCFTSFVLRGVGLVVTFCKSPLQKIMQSTHHLGKDPDSGAVHKTSMEPVGLNMGVVRLVCISIIRYLTPPLSLQSGEISSRKDTTSPFCRTSILAYGRGGVR